MSKYEIVIGLSKIEPSISIYKACILGNKLEKEPHAKAFTIPKLHWK
jgi:hypothetical protein